MCFDSAMPFLHLFMLQPKHQAFTLVWFLLMLATLVVSLCVVESVLPARVYAMELPSGYEHVSRRLLRTPALRPLVKETALATPRGIVLVDQEGFAVSTNPVWNACVRGERVFVGFIHTNRDVYIHRQGRIRKEIPMTCRDYHRGNVSVWKHPDFLDAELYLDSKGKLLGVLTQGFIVRSEL